MELLDQVTKNDLENSQKRACFARRILQIQQSRILAYILRENIAIVYFLTPEVAVFIIASSKWKCRGFFSLKVTQTSYKLPQVLSLELKCGFSVTWGMKRAAIP